MKAVILALILIDATILASGIAGSNPVMIVGPLVALPALLYLLLVAIPAAERKVDEILSENPDE